jgi:DNA-binding transcriptional ArsR family regulator
MARSRQSSGAGAPHLQANVAELRALAHPLRLRIMELFAESPKTTKHVAELLGEPPTRLYHHVAALERAGLIHLKETRKNRGTVEKWYESISRTMGSLPDNGRKRGSNAAAKRAVAMTVLEQSRREMVNAMAKPGAEPPLLARLVMRAPAAMVPTLRRRLYGFLKEIQTEFECDDSAPTADEHERWAMTLTFAPVWPTGSRAAEAPKRKT